MDFIDDGGNSYSDLDTIEDYFAYIENDIINLSINLLVTADDMGIKLDMIK